MVFKKQGFHLNWYMKGEINETASKYQRKVVVGYQESELSAAVTV